MEKDDFDYEKLISEVSKYRSLWDQRSLDYQNTTLKVKEWAVIALEMDSSVDEVKSKWRKLKDTFVREMRSVSKSGQTSKWSYFTKMSFLFQSFNKLLLPRNYTSPFAAENSLHTSSIYWDNEFFKNSVACSEENPESSQRKKIKTNLRTETLSSTPCQSSSQIQFNSPPPEGNNEDYYFLLSLLPSFERLSPQQKMYLKIKIMQDIYNASYVDPVVNLGSNSSSGIDTCSSDVTFDS